LRIISIIDWSELKRIRKKGIKKKKIKKQKKEKKRKKIQ